MTADTTIVQARLSGGAAQRLDHDVRVLGLRNRSEAVREGLRLLHREARHAALAQDYDKFYGHDAEVPISEIAAAGDQIAAESMASDDLEG